jgi:hypothetical protein
MPLEELAAEAQTLNQSVVAVEVCLLQVVKELAARARHRDKAAARVEVLLV